MAQTYRLGPGRRAINRAVRVLIRLGLMPGPTYLLTVPGRRTGRIHSTPVTLVEDAGARWLVSPYGEVGWVRNARAAGRVTLSRGARTETVTIHELSPADAAPVLQRYVTRVLITRPFFDAGPDSPLTAFVAEASRHPVFGVRSCITTMS